MGLSLQRFLSMTLREFEYARQHYRHKRELRWEQTRYLAALLLNVHVKSRKDMRQPQQLVPLELDKQYQKAQPKEPIVLSKEQINELKRKFGIPVHGGPN